MSAASDLAGLIGASGGLASGLAALGYRLDLDRRRKKRGADTQESPQDAPPGDGRAPAAVRREQFRLSRLVRKPGYVIPIAIILISAVFVAATYPPRGSSTNAAAPVQATGTTAPVPAVVLGSASAAATTATSGPSPQIGASATVSVLPATSGTPSTSAGGSGTAAPSAKVVPPVAPGLRNPYEVSMQKLILSDPMTSNSGAWHNPTVSGSCTFAADGLHVVANSDNAYHECHNSTAAADFTFEVSFTFSTATTAGLLFRDQGDGNSWYFAEVGNDSSTPYIGKAVKGQNDTIAAADSHFRFASVGGPHTLAIVAVGPRLTLFVDHQQVATGTDPSAPFVSGPVGVLMVNTANGGETVFRDARIWIAG